MALDKRSVRTETAGDVVAKIVDTGGSNELAVNASGEITEANSADILTSVQLIDDAVYTDGTGTATKGLAVMGEDGTNPQILKTDSDGHLQVDVLSGAGGTQYAEDTVHNTGDTGNLVLSVRADTAASTAGADGDYAGFITNSTGDLYVTLDGETVTVDNAGTFAVQVDGAALTSLQLIDDIVLTEDSVHTTGDSGVQILAVRNDTLASLVDTDGDYSALQVNASGALYTEVTNTVTVTATDLDIRDLTSASDSVEVLQATHDNLNLNANLQVGDADVTSSNPVPVNIVSEPSGVTAQAEYQATATLAAQASETLTFSDVTTSTTGRLTRAIISSEVPFKAEIQKDTGGTPTTIGVIFGEAGATYEFKPVNKNATLYEQAGGTGNNYQIVCTNNNATGIGASATINATIEWDEQ